MKNHDNLLGPGDSKTWNPCFNHGNDPRTIEPDEPWKVFRCVECESEIELWETCERWQFPIFCECGGDLEEL